MDLRRKSTEDVDELKTEVETGASSGRSGYAVNSRAVGVLCGFVVIVLFSSFTLVSRIGFASSLKLIDIAALRFSIAGTLMLPVLLHFGFAGVRVWEAIALTVTGGVGFALFAYAGFSLAPSSHGAVLLHGTLPLFSSLFACLVFSRKIGYGRGIGLFGILIGVCLMAWDSLTGSTSRQILGDKSLLLASVCWSAYGLLAQKIGLKPAHSASLVAVLSAFCYLPIYAFLPGKEILIANWHELAFQGVFQGVLIGAASIFVYSQAVAHLGAIDTALFTAAVPCVTTVAAIFLLSEVPSPLALSGVVIVTMGMAIAMKN